MILVQRLLNSDIHVEIPGMDTARNRFDKPRDVLAQELEQDTLPPSM
ncbi:hypothetical protein [Mycobacterium lepromatosis]|nr:hypothetical protein [Mycobacterium lepromatosis]